MKRLKKGDVICIIAGSERKNWVENAIVTDKGSGTITVRTQNRKTVTYIAAEIGLVRFRKTQTWSPDTFVISYDDHSDVLFELLKENAG